MSPELVEELERLTECPQNRGGPEDLRDGRGERLKRPPLSVFLREGVDHGDVLGVAHLLGEKGSA